LPSTPPKENNVGNQVNFHGPTTIGYHHTGDVHAKEYKPVVNMPIMLEDRYLEGMPKNYRDSLVDFVNIINSKIQTQSEHIEPEKSKQFQTEVNKVAEVTSRINDTPVAEPKKRSIRERLKSVALALVKMSPSIASFVLSSTVLGPYSSLVGNVLEETIKAALAES